MANCIGNTEYSRELNGCLDRSVHDCAVAACGPGTMHKTFLWFWTLMIACTLALMAIGVKKFVGPVEAASVEVGKRGNREDAAEGRLATMAVAQPGEGSIQPAHQKIPFSLVNAQMQLIRQDSPYLGLSLSEVPADVAAATGLNVGRGVYVSAVLDASAGKKAGVQVGDVLMQMNGIDLTGPDDVGPILAGKKAGDVVKVQFIRGGLRQSLHLTLGNIPLGLNVGQVPTASWLGADVQDIDAVMRIQFNLPSTRGILVSHVVPDSPAAIAGLAVGDLIRTAASQRIRDVAQFQALMHKSKPGQQLHLGIQRAGAPKDLDVVLAVQPSNLHQSIPFLAPPDVTIEGAWIGMDISELTRKDVTALGLLAGTRGILVNDVEGPPATTVGFQSGDVITAVNGMSTPDIKSFVAATQRQTGAVAEVIRGDKHFFISIPPPGYTQQGTRLHIGLDRKFRQVTATQPAIISVLVVNKDINNARVADEQRAEAVILVDLSRKAYSMVELRDVAFLPDLLKQQSVTALLCGDVGAQTRAALTSQGTTVYSGVVGNALNAIAFYQQHGLIAAGG